jgi:NAD(P)-dependent dehydrogenase (short-subunit alcohol dehydrogenase family)
MTISIDQWTGAAVVTGAGSGLGASMAQRFADAGMPVVALDIDAARAEETAVAIRDAGGKAISARVDVSDRASLESAAQAAREAFGGCSVLCANVGVQNFGLVEKLTEGEWRWVLDVNVLGVVNTANAFLPLMRETGGERRILVTASSGALVPGARLGAYTASKYAVMGIGETLRIELADEGIGVCTLFPAGMSSRHLESSALARPTDLSGAVVTQEDIDVMMQSRNLDVSTHMVSPEQATRNLLRDLEANHRFIITHGDYREDMVERLDDLVAAFDRAQD